MPLSVSPNSLSRPVLQCTVSPLSSPSTVFTAFTAAFYTVEPRSYQHRDKSLQCHLILSNFLLPVIFSGKSSLLGVFWGFFLFVMLLCGGSLLWASRGNRSTLLLEPVALAQFLGKVKGLLVKAAWKPHLAAALAHEAGPAVIGEEFAGGMLSSYSETTCRNFRPLTPWGISSQ